MIYHGDGDGDDNDNDNDNEIDIIDPRKMLRRGGSLVVADMPLSSPVAGTFSGAAAAAAVNKPQPQPQPTVFEEPDANALLDSFGF